MFDITASECSKGMYIFCSLFYLLVTFSFRKKYNVNNPSKEKVDIAFFILVLAYMLFSFRDGDYWHYREFVVNNDEFWKPSEEIYEYIAMFLGRHYLLFRSVVWGTALCLYLGIVKRMNLNRNATLYFLFTVYILFFAYARASLAMAVFFLGLSCVLKPKQRNKSSSIVSGIAIMLLSYFFHHSMLALILMSLVCLFPVNKYIYVSLFIFMPIVAVVAQSILENFMGMGIDTMESIYMKMEGYSEHEAESMSILETIRSLWQYSLFYIPFVISSVIVFSPKNRSVIPPHITKLYSMTFAIILFATCFLFMGFKNNIMFYRFLYMSMIPLSVLICYFKENGLLPFRYYKYIIKWAVMYVVISDLKKLLRFSPIN